jgi:hypothetical protein
MAGLLGTGPVTPEEQLKNDRHHWAPVTAVLLFLAVFIYLFTYASEDLDLPMPQSLAATLGWEPVEVFDDDGNVDSSLYIPLTFIYDNDDERFILFAGIAVAFLLVYFLPLKYKRESLFVSFCFIMGILYGTRGLAGLAMGHALVYLFLHPVSRYRLAIAGLPGFLGVIAFAEYSIPSARLLLQALLTGSVGAFFYVSVMIPFLKKGKMATLLQTLVVHSALFVTLGGALYERETGDTFEIALGVLLFFWHWERLILYHIDYKDGRVPEDISLVRYLSIFMTPAQLAHWTNGVSIAQGYSYCEDHFLCEDKNKLVIDGLKLWAIALIYLVFGDWLLHHFLNSVSSWTGVEFFLRNRLLACHFVDGGAVSTSTVLLTTLADLLRWTTIWGGVVHFKVGLWRICGYRVDPYFNYPWISTNLVVLWSRLTFHYREFLVRAFYYPVFFKCFKKSPHLRILCATLSAATVGNLVWGHMTEGIFYNGVEWANIVFEFKRWPYFLLLGLGITVSQFWLMHKKKSARKPWTFDRRIGLDILATYITLQFYALIHVFMHPCSEGTLWDHFQLFLIGLGGSA